MNVDLDVEAVRRWFRHLPPHHPAVQVLLKAAIERMRTRGVPGPVPPPRTGS
ncbi:MAG: hypothetical protein ABMB14_06600 [Myxococcota bacterium]